MTRLDRALAHVDPAAAADEAEGAARRFGNMKRWRFEALCDGWAGQLETEGERRALAEIRREGPRALAKTFREEAQFWRARVRM